MPFSLPSVPYPPAKKGFWLPVTSTLNWCEEDYYATEYAAEIVNTVTNLLVIVLACYGMVNCIKHGHDRIFFVTFFGFLIVGSGSFAFHATLKYPMQLVDELSMIYTTNLMCWASFGHLRPLSTRIWLGFLFGGIAVFITLYYHYLQDPTFHQTAYAILTFVVLTRSMWNMEVALRPTLAKREAALRKKEVNNAAEQDRRDARDRKILRSMWAMVGYGLGIFLGGFALWNVDNAICSSLRQWRKEIGLPWGVLLEGHGWWHIMTGIGAYFYITWGIWLRHCLNGRQDEFECIWPRTLTSLPIVVKRRSFQNGAATKKDI